MANTAECGATAMSYTEFVRQAKASGRSYNFDALKHAYQVANAAHSGQTRRSGEPYITHPLSVAALLVDLGLDTEALVAALLHDVVEDTAVTLPEVAAQFGDEVALLVDGVTKLGRITFSSMEEEQAENLRKMLLAMSRDVRVMLIKLCDRLHNMRTADAWAPQTQRDKSLETMEVYAPIAHRLGISGIKEELEDRSLHYLDPIGYAEIVELIGQKANALEYVADIAAHIKARLDENDLEKAVIHSRVKSIYSIYRKMFVQNRSFEEIYDTYAIRIILDTISECYTALGVIHDMYHPLPNRFKDYISTPKPNMYQSLHTTLISHESIAFEVQIRTHEMDQLAEYGVAAHWKYKAGLQGQDDKLEERLAWVRQLLESQRDSEDSGNLLRDIKSELLPESVFAFTPKGDVIDLPSGATVIDFAYAIHSAVGNRMVGAKVNTRIVPIDHKVVTGEVIEIMTGPSNKGPSRDWLNIVTTSEAKSKIRNWFKKERKNENIEEGKAALDREMRRGQVSIPADEYDAFMENIARRQRMNTTEEMYAAIGYGGLQTSRLMPKIKEEYAKLVKAADPTITFNIPAPKKPKASGGVVVEGIDNVLIKFAKCCSPLPGDDIVGFITRGYGVSIHKKDCRNAAGAEHSPRWLKAYWAEGVKEDFTATLEIIAMDRDRLFADISSLLADMRVPVYAINARRTADGRAAMSATISVRSTEHLDNIIARLHKIKDVVDVLRV